jgi:hypothetical protein
MDKNVLSIILVALIFSAFYILHLIKLQFIANDGLNWRSQKFLIVHTIRNSELVI